MSVALSQTTGAAFPDRPLVGGVGMSMSLGSGGDGESLTVELATAASVLHARLLVHPNTVGGGRAVLMLGRNTAGFGTFRLTLDATSGSFVVETFDGQMLTAPVFEELGWHCVEIGIDSSAGEVELWLNGRSRGTLGSVAGLQPTSRVLAGAIYKDSGTTGELYIDEWVLSSEYIGPVIVPAAGEYADQPARWLVIYNESDADSIEWAAWYRQQRSVPYANLLGLELSSNETINQTELDALRQAVVNYLDQHNLNDQILGILCGHGVPGYYTPTVGPIEPIVGQLQKLTGDNTTVPNPGWQLDDLARPTGLILGQDVKLTARIDGPTLADSKALVDRAVDIGVNGLGDGGDATLWFDAVTPGSFYESTVERMIEWAASVDRQALRIPLQITQPAEPPTEQQFDLIDHDGFFWGWRADTPPAGFFDQSAGRRVFAIQLTDTAATGPTLRDDQSDTWMITALQAGYAAAAGSSRTISISCLPYENHFFEALRRGWTLGEAWAVAVAFLRCGLALIGDPLMRVPLPKAGWNVYGPFERLAEARFDQPVAMLRDDEHQWSPEAAQRPAEGEVGVYVVRHVDSEGREETGVNHVRVMSGNGAALSMALEPAWPSGAGWRPQRDGSDWRILAAWPVPLKHAGVARVALISQVQGEDEQVVAEADIAPRSFAVELYAEISVQPTRFKLRVHADSGAWLDTPWSAWMEPVTAEVLLLANHA